MWNLYNLSSTCETPRTVPVTLLHMLYQVAGQRIESWSTTSMWHPQRWEPYIKAQLHWAGYRARIEDHRIPKGLFFGQLEKGKRSVKNTAQIQCLGSDCLRAHKVAWCLQWKSEHIRREMKRKAESAFVAIAGLHVCAKCNWVCRSRIGLISHKRSHRS